MKAVSSVGGGRVMPFAILTFLIYLFPVTSFDITISKSIQSIHFYVFDFLMKAVSSVGGGRVMPFAILTIASAITFLNLKLEALYLSISSAISILASELIKMLVSRPRPESDLVQIYKHLSDKSFPSSHTISYTVVFGFLFYIAYIKLKPSWQKNLILVIPLFLIFTIGISRIYLGVHWASDVLGGYLLGTFLLLQTINIYKSHAKR